MTTSEVVRSYFIYLLKTWLHDKVWSKIGAMTYSFSWVVNTYVRLQIFKKNLIGQVCDWKSLWKTNWRSHFDISQYKVGSQALRQRFAIYGLGTNYNLYLKTGFKLFIGFCHDQQINLLYLRKNTKKNFNDLIHFQKWHSQ